MVDLLDRFNVKITETKDHILLEFPWDRHPAWTKLKDEIKGMEASQFFKEPRPHWRVRNSQRNWWTLDLLADKQPYNRYRKDLQEYEPFRPCLYHHQREALNFVLTRRQCILAGEMGTGKTLVLIEALERIKPEGAWYIAPRFAIYAIKMLFKDWNAQVIPEFYSYDEMKKIVTTWESGKKAPQVLIFDESAYIKEASSQRSQCARHLADACRNDHPNAFVLLASGAPAPKNPKDWWHQCEVARPGYLKELNIYNFERRIALIENVESFAGVSYPKLVTWWDDSNKCKHCGMLADHPNHGISNEAKLAQLTNPLANIGMATTISHKFEPSINELEALAQRLKGLVLVQFKKDCLDLPDKIYRIVQCEPSKQTLRAAALIARTSQRSIEALTRLRELSDGFQYNSEPTGEFETCQRCAGTSKIVEGEEMPCPSCKDGKVPIMKRIAKRIPCPKDGALKELLFEAGKRIVIFGAFTETIDRIVDVCKGEGWAVIRVDGTTRILPNGCWTSENLGDEPLRTFQSDDDRQIAFIANQATAKTALTLTAASIMVYYSNTFNGDDRIQSEDRIHRIGMDANKGAIIADLVHLPSDMYVRDNLVKKRELQSITLGELQEFMKGETYAYMRD